MYFASYVPADANAAEKVLGADVIVRQVLDFAPQTDDLCARGRTVLVPLISAPFLWPNSGRPHPRNAPAPYLEASGAYGADLGDSFLDRLIMRNVPVDAAVAEYLAADVAAVRHVDRMREIVLDKQRVRDAACGGYNFGDIIDMRLASEPLFRTANHPERPLTFLLAEKVFERIGVSSDLIAKVREYPGHLFPATKAPIHPSIARHFGLSYADAATRYRFFDEGSYTFEEYAHRYMGYVWNADLPLGMHLARNGDQLEAIAVLRQAVAALPRSPAAHAILSDLLARHEQPAEAVALARRASELEPDNAHLRSRVGHLEAALRESHSAAP